MHHGLENVKPRRRAGTKEMGAEVDQAEFLTAVENDASASLVAAVRQSVEQLPHKIYEDARDREAEQDLDGAGEAYLRFLEAFCRTTAPRRRPTPGSSFAISSI